MKQKKMSKFKYYKVLKNGIVDGLMSKDVYKVLKETELISCFETYVSYDKNHIKLSMLPKSKWIEITYEEMIDILTETGWGQIYKKDISQVEPHST
jgi:hypothetical protein